MASSTIDTYLTPTTRPYYEKVHAIVENLKTALESVKSVNSEDEQYYTDWEEYNSKQKFPFPVCTQKPGFEYNNCEIYIFGGYIRNIIEHYHSQAEVFIPPNDVDIFIRFDEQYVRTPSQTTWKRLFVPFIVQSLAINHTITYGKIKHNHYGDYDYGLARITIDGINFDITTHINDFQAYCPRFDELSDYTVNNLMIDTRGNLSTRVKIDQYGLQSCLEHIQQRQLVFINNETVFRERLSYDEDGSIFAKYMDDRKAKMLAYGYAE